MAAVKDALGLDGTLALTETSSGTQSGTSSGNSITGDSTSTSDSTGTTTTVTRAESLDGLTWSEATITVTSDSESTETGNGITGSYTQSGTASLTEQIDQIGDSPANAFTYSGHRTADVTSSASGNSITGQSTGSSATDELYDFDQTYDDHAGNTWTLAGDGTRTVNTTSSSDALTGEYSRTSQITDDYHLDQVTTDVDGVQMFISLDGTETATESEQGNSQTGVFSRTASGSGDGVGSENGVTGPAATNWTVTQAGNYLDGNVTLDVGGVARYDYLVAYMRTAENALGLAGTLDYSPTGLPVMAGSGPGAPTGGLASPLGDATVDELMSRMAGSSSSAADDLSGLLAAAGASGYAPALAASGASLDAAFAEVGRDHIHMYCFAAGTLVTMADGTQRPIETLHANDLILAAPDTDPTATPRPSRIERIFHNAPAALLNIHIGQEILRVSHNHPLYIHNRGWVPAGEVNIGNEMLTVDGNFTPITDLFDNGDIEPVFNLQIADCRTYYVGEQGLLVHNTSPMLQALIDQSAEALVGGVYGFLHDTEIYFGGDGSITQWSFEFVAAEINRTNEQLKAAMKYVSDNVQKVIGDIAEFLSPAYEGLNWVTGGNAALAIGIAGSIAVGIGIGMVTVVNPPLGFALMVGVTAGVADGILTTHAMNPNASIEEMLVGAALGAAFGAMNPTMAVASLGGGLYGGAVEYFLFDGDFHGTGYLIGSMVGGLGAGIQQGFKAAIRTGCDASTTTKLIAGFRSVAPEALGGAIAGGAAYYHTGDLKTAVGAAGLGMMGGSLLRAIPGVRRFADPTRGLCFAAGTLVNTPGGKKPIESIQAGELVLSRSDDDPDAPIEPKVVEELFVRQGVLWRLTVAGRDLFCTAEHPFYVQDQGWTPAWQLAPGHRLSTDCGEWVPVESVECTDVETEVYNFRVADYHTYFVGGSGWGFSVWAHNANCWNDFQSAIASSSGNLTSKQVQKAYAAAVNGNWNRFRKILGGKGFSADEISGAYRAARNTSENPNRLLTAKDANPPRLVPRKYGKEAGETPPKNWGEYITEQTGVHPPKGMKNSHGHHGCMKEGKGSQVPFVEKTKRLSHKSRFAYNGI